LRAFSLSTPRGRGPKAAWWGRRANLEIDRLSQALPPMPGDSGLPGGAGGPGSPTGVGVPRAFRERGRRPEGKSLKALPQGPGK